MMGDVKMIRVLLCCMGGFSSGAMVQKVTRELKESEYCDLLTIDFHPFSSAFKVMENYDIIITCPHTRYLIPDFVKKYKPQIPIYTLPPKMYGAMTPKSIYEDACDVIDGYKKDGRNPWIFEGEENNLRIKRAGSHREAMQGK